MHSFRSGCRCIGEKNGRVRSGPNAEITKLKFTIPKQAGSPVVVMYAYLDNLKIADISAAPFR